MTYTFEAGMKRLEEIRTLLDREDTPLEDLMALYKEGIGLSAELEKRLKVTEDEIRKIEGASEDE